MPPTPTTDAPMSLVEMLAEALQALVHASDGHHGSFRQRDDARAALARYALARYAAETTLRVESPDLHKQFAAMAPSASLPWSVHRRKPWRIVDANGEDVLDVTDDTTAERDALVGMILVAVNTCGGFRAATLPPRSTPTHG